jgi:hypothetical protein
LLLVPVVDWKFGSRCIECTPISLLVLTMYKLDMLHQSRHLNPNKRKEIIIYNNISLLLGHVLIFLIAWVASRGYIYETNCYGYGVYFYEPPIYNLYLVI